MTTCREAVLSAKVLTHINVEDQMTLDLLISWRYITLWFLPGLKCRANVIHILSHWIPPQCITIIMAELNSLIHILWDPYPELVSLRRIIGLHFRNYIIPLFKVCGTHQAKAGPIKILASTAYSANWMG